MERPPIIPIAEPAEAVRPPRIPVPGLDTEPTLEPAKKGKGKKAPPAPAEGESTGEVNDTTST